MDTNLAEVYTAADVKTTFLSVTLLTFSAIVMCKGQTTITRDHWGEKFNSPGTQLTYKETAHTSVQGRTVITYNLYASGLPKDQHCVLWVLNVGDDPRGNADAYLNEEGKVVNVLADPEHHVKEDPIDMKVFGGKAEPIGVALISDDGALTVFAQIIPFPMEKTSGPCHLSLVQRAPYYSVVSIAVNGFQPGEEFSAEQRSENEVGQTGKADEKGNYNAIIVPLVKGKRSGKAGFFVTAKSCKIGIEFPWGEGSYQYQ